MPGAHEERRRWARTSPAAGASVTIARATDVELIDISGSGTLTINNDISKTSVKIPSALQMTMNSKARLVQ